MKIAKPVVTLDKWVGRNSCCITEHRKSCDKEIKPYIRAKRQHKSLPNSWDTKWICVRQYRNWKDRCRKRHQWEKHKQTPREIERVTGHFPEKYLMYLYGHADRWVEIDWDHMADVEKLVEEGKLEGGYVKHTTRWYRWNAKNNIPYLKFVRKPG